MRFDKTLADELFRNALRKINPKKRARPAWSEFNIPGVINTGSIADYAAARATQWPGESRVLIEREWMARQEATRKKGTGNYGTYGNNQIMQGLIMAMAAIDPQRALEMSDLISDQYNLQGAARGEIALALLHGPDD